MSTDGWDGEGDLLESVFADPAAGREQVPQLLGLLDTGEPRDRLAAAWALTLVAEASPEVAAPLTRRLVDRLADQRAGVDGSSGTDRDDSSDEVDTEMAAALTLTYLRWRYPETVDETLETLAEEAAEQERRLLSRRLAADTGRGITPSQVTDRDVGRTQLPNRADTGSRRIYRREGHRIAGAPEDGPADPTTDETDTAGEGETGAESDADPAGGDADEGEVATADATARSTRTEWRQELAALEKAIGLDDIVAQSVFEDLTIAAPAVEGRFTDIYRTRAARRGSEDGIALRVFHPPEGDNAAFTDALVDGLSNWDAVSDHELVVDLYDWDGTPRPWMATEYTTTTLYDRIDIDIEEAIWNCLKVAEAISHAHEHGVLHTGLDPFSVVYTDAVLEARQQPLVAHFGLLDAVRQQVDPATYLDPRYAAPEYFDDSFGAVDQSTDIYGLGGIVYSLLTGRPPYTGEYASVRRGVLTSSPPEPTAINPEIPDWVDRVVQKAMARQKLTRYESAAQLTADIRREVEG